MDETKQPGINFNNIILKEVTFRRSPGIIEKPELDINFNVISAISEDKKSLNLEVVTILKEKKGLFNLEFSLIGNFSIIGNSENMSLEEFSKTNASALMMPYIRETISNITLRSGLKPVIIPPINIISMVNKKTATIDSNS